MLFSQWFTLDMGGVFEKAADYPDNVMWALSPYNRGGRYFPIYWFYNFVVFGFFSTNIAAHFAVQSMLFVISLTLTCYLFFRVTNNPKATLVFGVIAGSGGAVAENLYTMGKAEPLAYLFMISILVIFYTTDLKRSALRFASISVLFSLAIWSKETSLVLLGFGPVAIVASMFVTRVRIRSLGDSAYLPRYSILLLTIVAGYLISKIPYLAFSKGSGSTSYVDYKIDLELVTENLLFYFSQQPDVLFFGVAALVLCGMAALRLRSLGNKCLPKARSNFIFVASLLLMAWSYYLPLLVWRWPMGYYMLLPSIVFKFATIYGLVFVLENKMIGARAFRVTCFGVFICVVYALIHSFYVVTSQIAYSRMYTEAVSKYLADSKMENRLIIESFPFYSEQVTNTKQLISLVSGENRVVGGIADLLDPEVVTPKILKLLHISQEQLDNNENALPGKDDYLLLMTGDKLATWFVRGVTPYFSDDSILKKYGAYDMIPIAENKLFNPSAFLNIWTNRIYFGSTYLGYKLYKVTSDRPKIIWKNRHPDGWIGKTASIKVFPEFGERVLVTVSTPSFNSPNRLIVTQDDVLVQNLALVEGKELSFEVNSSGEKIPTTLRFLVERTAVPKALKINKDKRELGVLIRVEPRR